MNYTVYEFAMVACVCDKKPGDWCDRVCEHRKQAEARHNQALGHSMMKLKPSKGEQ